jgi:hypothetical protein
MWKNYVEYSLLWKLDILCASVEFILLIIYFAFVNILSWKIQILFPFCVAICYLIANIFHVKQMWHENTWFHIIFRYVGYLWCHVGLVKTKELYAGIIFLSCSYYFYIFILMYLSINNEEFDMDKKYWMSVYKM